jgi:ATPase family associated with various cellular activities (AAA)
VFGPPGAGKGFAVKNIAETLPDKLKDLIKEDRHECNLTALSDPEDLAHYFQLSRNGALRGKVPLLFFDEFDCSVDRTPFYWLKHFLAPLQDGKFRSGHNVHPIGRAIFIFAGGVYTTFKDFSEAMEKNRKLTQPKNQDTVAGADQATGALTYDPQGEAQQNFKGVDFLSRLHGHIDVKAFSPRDAKDPEIAREGLFRCNGHDIVADPCFLMRRAFVLRSLLEMHLQKIFTQGASKKARINRKVVNALLATKEFNHGARSMEAIIRMSFLENAESFEIAHLPPDDQLRMHVEGDNFKYCLDNDVDALWSEAGSRQASAKKPRQPGNGPLVRRPRPDRIARPDRRAAAALPQHHR